MTTPTPPEPIEDVIEEAVNARRLATDGDYKVIRDQIIAIDGGWVIADVHSTPRLDIRIGDRAGYTADAIVKSYNAIPHLIAEIERLRGLALYTQHLPNCKSREVDIEGVDYSCDCGLAEKLGVKGE